MSSDDRDLYEYFAAVRREETARVPPMPLPSLIADVPRRRSLPAKLVTATACLAIIIAGIVWMLPRSRVPHQRANRERQQVAVSITSWKPATDFLLNTPGREILQGVPAIGEWPRDFSKPVLP